MYRHWRKNNFRIWNRIRYMVLKFWNLILIQRAPLLPDPQGWTMGTVFMFDIVQVRVWSSRGAGRALPHILRQENRRGDPPCLPGQVQDPWIPQQLGAVLGTRDILMRIRIRGSTPLPNGSGSNSRSDSSLQRLLGSGSVPLTDGSRSVSWRPKNMRIPNTGLESHLGRTLLKKIFLRTKKEEIMVCAGNGS